MRSVSGASAVGDTGRLIIVTGVAGSGRASAMRVLEDLGFYCVDNLPVALAATVMRLAIESDPALRGVALGIDPRERLFFPQWPRVFADLEHEGFRLEILFLDASDEVLLRRYSESRRPHPMAESGAGVIDGIRSERMALAEMRERASRVIDTSALTVHELRELITAATLGSGAGSAMTVALVSFGYKYGAPVGMDLMFDVRFLPNPFFVPELRALDGIDGRVRDFVMAQPDARRFIEETGRLLDFLLPLYRREGKSYLTIGLGCTGGRHRSPVLARALAKRLAADGTEIQVRHNDIAR
ncbi:MAG TPA: RNase adapter RapZ [Candidatus Binataceae bacterium]|nr:RNase adapter RapZ [Candidatus Binataceae bacterium]